MFRFRFLHVMHLCILHSALCTCKAPSSTAERCCGCFTDVLAFLALPSLTVPTYPTYLSTCCLSILR